jgi:hypothetical protein
MNMGHWRKEHREEAKEKTDKRRENDGYRRGGGWKKGWRGWKIKEMVTKRCKRLEIDTEI